MSSQLKKVLDGKQMDLPALWKLIYEKDLQDRVSFYSIKNWYSGLYEPSLENRKWLADLLHVDSKDLISE